MQVTTLSSATRYLLDRGITCAGGSWRLTRGEPVAVSGLERLRVPRLVPVANFLRRLLMGKEDGAVMLLIDERGVWPSSEDWLPLTLLRQRGGCGGDSADFDAHPATLLAPYETAELSSMIACCLAGGLGFVAAHADGGRAARVNHDGAGWIACNDAAERAAGAALFAAAIK